MRNLAFRKLTYIIPKFSNLSHCGYKIVMVYFVSLFSKKYQFFMNCTERLQVRVPSTEHCEVDRIWASACIFQCKKSKTFSICFNYFNFLSNFIKVISRCLGGNPRDSMKRCNFRCLKCNNSVFIFVYKQSYEYFYA